MRTVTKQCGIVFAILFLCFVGQQRAYAQAFTCAASIGGTPPFVRGEALADLVSNIALNCTGGTPTAAGAPVPQYDIIITFNTNVTSMLTAPGFSEALMLVDLPHTGLGSTAGTLLACGDAGTNDDGSGFCSITGDGVGANTYDGTAGHPNVFEGQTGTATSLVWKAVPLDPPGPKATRNLNFTNLRADASSIGVANGPNPSQIKANVTISSGGPAISTPRQTVALVVASVGLHPSPSPMSQCLSANPSIAVDPSKGLDSGTQDGEQFSLFVGEDFTYVFNPKNYAQFQANSGPPIGTAYPSDVNQNDILFSYPTESGFFNGSTDPMLPNITLPPTPPFPSIRGLNLAGTATSGTRFYMKFSPLLAGLQLFVPVTVPLFQSGTSTRTGVAVLTATDANGAGPFTPVAGNATGLAPVPVAGGTPLAVYEILADSPGMLEGLVPEVAAAYLANKILAGQVSVEYGLAPFSLVNTADSVSPIPRFIEVNKQSAVAFNVLACPQAVPSTTQVAAINTVFSPAAAKVTVTAQVTTTLGPVTGGTVDLSIPGVGTASGIAVLNGAASASITIPAGHAPGNYSILATFTGVAAQGIGGSSAAVQALTISKAPTTITWAAPAGILVGTPLGPLQLNAVGSVPGTLVYTPPAGTLLPQGLNQILTVTFTPNNTTDYLPATQTVTINVTTPIAPGPPFGFFDTPATNSNVNGSVGFTGWALAPGGISSVDVWREPIPAEGTALVYIGTAVLVPGARPDVQALFPNYPNSGSAGWGFLVLTNELPDSNGDGGVGNGTYNIHALAHDPRGNTTDLGVKTIVVDNLHATTPFGVIDTPAQGGTVSGTAYVNFGWALAQKGNEIPIEGSTIWVFIDGLPMGHPVYNQFRSDIATLFPGYPTPKGLLDISLSTQRNSLMDCTPLPGALPIIRVVFQELAAATSLWLIRKERSRGAVDSPRGRASVMYLPSPGYVLEQSGNRTLVS